MEQFLLYFLKANLLMVVFYLLYKGLLANQSWFQMNRIVLLAISVLAVFAPLYQPTFVDTTYSLLTINLPPLQVLSNNEVSESISILNVVVIIYSLVSSTLLLILGRHLFVILSQKGGNSEDDYRIFSTTQISTSTFFKWIFLSIDLDQETKNIVLKHEKVHADHWHSVDILWFELLSIIFWINPFIWLFKKELRLTHEYIADAETRNSVGQKEYLNALLKHTFQTNSITIIPMFSDSQTLLNRINMMKKNKPVIKLRYLLLIPIIGAVTLLSAFSQQKHINILPVENPVQEVYKEVEKMPEFPGGQDAMIKYLGSNIQYPKSAANENIEGKVFISFVVTSKGSITKTEVLRGLNAELDAEAMRVINSMPKWTPGEKDGKKVDVQFTLPIMFKLN